MRANARRRLDDLHAAGLLDEPERAEFARRIEVDLPDRAARGIVHGDLCPANLVAVDPGGLVSIDNERVRIHFVDHDLARTWTRWAMTPDEEREFAQRYHAHGRTPLERRTADAWRVCTVVKSASTLRHTPDSQDCPARPARTALRPSRHPGSGHVSLARAQAVDRARKAVGRAAGPLFAARHGHFFVARRSVVTLVQRSARAGAQPAGFHDISFPEAAARVGRPLVEPEPGYPVLDLPGGVVVTPWGHAGPDDRHFVQELTFAADPQSNRMYLGGEQAAARNHTEMPGHSVSLLQNYYKNYLLSCKELVRFDVLSRRGLRPLRPHPAVPPDPAAGLRGRTQVRTASIATGWSSSRSRPRGDPLSRLTSERAAAEPATSRRGSSTCCTVLRPVRRTRRAPPRAPPRGGAPRGAS
ncbi:MAG: phosphotransferase [Acidimicrobiia bacterium]